MEDASALELRSIIIPDFPKDVPQIDRFGEHQQERIAEAPAETFCAGITLCEGKEVMEQVLPDGENVSSDSSEELDSNEGTPRCCCSDNISQVEEESEDRKELTGEPTEELTSGQESPLGGI